jgi:hypothetical protein
MERGSGSGRSIADPIVICCKFARSVCLNDGFQSVQGSFPTPGDLSVISEPGIATPAASEFGINITHSVSFLSGSTSNRWRIAESVRLHGRRFARLLGHAAARSLPEK